MLRTDLIGKIVDYDMIVVESFKDVGDFGHNMEIDVTINPGRYKQTGRLVGIELDHGKLYYLIENTNDEGLAAVEWSELMTTICILFIYQYCC